ncbi:hypothetical protein IAG44_24675 [Streptomyces roseirectus]|uniref:Roadblock/LAMTOR2 domain-containing protein n=1 Tax=Streptomyces roseirectus TaxID=2768066 RepID=A0A7H0IHN1_9ACTN|nr:hypothetical protein [Streptomyces roseirectus]QNP72297.1 hypothetical protein IAG44_24675 [Streptomyces roseirectus]
MPGIDECLLEAMRLPGARGAALVDWTSGLALGIVGEFPGGDPEIAATESAELARLATEQRAFTPDPSSTPSPSDAPPITDLIITNPDSYHLLHFLPTSLDTTAFLHICLTRHEGNLALTRIRLEELARKLVLA